MEEDVIVDYKQGINYVRLIVKWDSFGKTSKIIYSKVYRLIASILFTTMFSNIKYQILIVCQL
jgi:hypothetical protein